jgi:parallel beta-helix repeat protein
MQYHSVRAWHIFLIILLVDTNVFVLGVLGNSVVDKKMIYVDDNADPGWYDATHVKTIQEGIINASDGGTVYVYNGTYYENINLSKSLSLIGEDPRTTFIDCRQHGNIINIETNNITVARFTLQNGTENTIWERWAINIQKNVIGPNAHIRNFTISQCFITDNKGVILLHNVSDCKIQNCNIYNNSRSSITIRFDSGNIQIENSTFIHNGKQVNEGYYNGGIYINGYFGLCTNLVIKNCTIYENIGAGIEVFGVHNMSVDHSFINDSSWFGIIIEQSVENITIHHNTISGNRYEGMRIIDGTVGRRSLRSIRDIFINNNIIANNGGILHTYGGLFICNCINGIRIVDNTIISNDKYGIYFDSSRNNQVIDNNFINNTNNAQFIGRVSLWNEWVGNYWDNWIGLGPKIIRGKLIVFPWYNFDWHPAKEPYDIPGMS